MIKFFKNIFKKSKSIITIDNSLRFEKRVYKGYTFNIPNKFINVPVDMILDEMFEFVNELSILPEQVYFKPEQYGGIAYMIRYKEYYKTFKDLDNEEYMYSNNITHDRFIIIPSINTESMVYNISHIDTFLHELYHLKYHNLDKSVYIPKFIKEYEAIVYAHRILKNFPIPMTYNTPDSSLDFYIKHINYVIYSGKEYLIKHLNNATDEDIRKFLTKEIVEYIKDVDMETYLLYSRFLK